MMRAGILKGDMNRRGEGGVAITYEIVGSGLVCQGRTCIAVWFLLLELPGGDIRVMVGGVIRD